MTTDLEPRSHDDLDALLRRTLSGRAATVEHGPSLVTAPRRRNRTPWLAGAAAAVAVLAVAGGLVYLHPGDDGGTATGGSVPTACRGALPAPWRTAMAGKQLTVDGRPAYAHGVYTDGRIIGGWLDADLVDHVALLPESGAPTELYRIPANRIDDRYSTDGSDAVLSINPKIPANNPDSPVDDIVVIDLASGARRHIFADAPIPAGWVVTTGAVVQDGFVYLAIGPDSHNPANGRILRYDIATRVFTAVATVSGAYPEVEQDVRGVSWPGGSVPARDVPAGLPAPFVTVDGESQYQELYSDGRAAAWTERTDPFVVHWTDGRGRTAAFAVHTQKSTAPEFTPEVTAVSGPFVTLITNDTGDPTTVLDARTGAFADTGSTAEEMVSAEDELVFSSADTGVLQVATGSLPGIACTTPR